MYRYVYIEDVFVKAMPYYNRLVLCYMHKQYRVKYVFIALRMATYVYNTHSMDNEWREHKVKIPNSINRRGSWKSPV